MLRVAGRLLFAVYCPLHGACRLDVVGCIMRVVCCIFPVACCRFRGVCCTFSCGALHVVPCVSSAARCPLEPVECTLPLVRFRPPAPVPRCRVVCAVCRLSQVASRHVACSALRVVRCMLHVARSQSHRVSLPVPSRMPYVACCKTRVLRCFLSLVRCRSHSGMSSVACRRLQSDTAPSHTPRIAAAHAIERLSGRRDLLQTEVCVRACGRACVWVGSKRTVCRCGLLCMRRGYSRVGAIEYK
jgi:hypothetical protein